MSCTYSSNWHNHSRCHAGNLGVLQFVKTVPVISFYVHHQSIWAHVLSKGFQPPLTGGWNPQWLISGKSYHTTSTKLFLCCFVGSKDFFFFSFPFNHSSNLAHIINFMVILFCTVFGKNTDLFFQQHGKIYTDCRHYTKWRQHFTVPEHCQYWTLLAVKQS